MDKKQLITTIQQDPTLTSEEKAEIITKLSDETFSKKLIHEITGAGIGFAISKFFKLSKPAQALLTLAGFGIGRYLLEETRKHDRFLQYDDKLKTYKINA